MYVMNTRWMKSLLHLLRRIEDGAGEAELREGIRRFLEEEYGVRARFVDSDQPQGDSQRSTPFGVLEIQDPLRLVGIHKTRTHPILFPQKTTNSFA